MLEFKGVCGYRIPLIVSTTGHRDVAKDAIPLLAGQVKVILRELSKALPNTPICILSALAEGADRLVARTALDLKGELDVHVIAPLPFERQEYARDFSDLALQEFNDLLGNVDEYFALEPHRYWNTPDLRSNVGSNNTPNSYHGAARDAQYAQLGAFLARHCHVLLALWDGRILDKPGGTGQVVKVMVNQTMNWGRDNQLGPDIDVPAREGLQKRSLVGGGELGAVLHLQTPREHGGSASFPWEDQAPPGVLKSFPKTHGHWYYYQPLDDLHIPASMTERKAHDTAGESDATKSLADMQREELSTALTEIEGYNQLVKSHLKTAIGAAEWNDEFDGDKQELDNAAPNATAIFFAADHLARFLQTRSNWFMRMQYAAVLFIAVGFALLIHWPIAWQHEVMIQSGEWLFFAGGLVFVVLNYLSRKKRWSHHHVTTRALCEMARVAMYATYARFARKLGDRGPEARNHLPWLEAAWPWLVLHCWRLDKNTDDQHTRMSNADEWWVKGQARYFQNTLNKLNRTGRLYRIRKSVYIVGIGSLLLIPAFWIFSANWVENWVHIAGFIFVLAAVFTQWLEAKNYREDRDRYKLALAAFQGGLEELHGARTTTPPSGQAVDPTLLELAQFALEENHRWYRTHVDRSLSIEA